MVYNYNNIERFNVLHRKLNEVSRFFKKIKFTKSSTFRYVLPEVIASLFNENHYNLLFRHNLSSDIYRQNYYEERCVIV